MIQVDRGMFHYSVTTEPTTEPVSLAEAKLFARIDTVDDDALVTALIIAARQNVEGQTGRTFITTARLATLDFMPGATLFELAHRPILSVASVRAYNDDGTYSELTVADDIILDEQNARVTIKSTAASLSGDASSAVFQIAYSAGYGNAAACPEWAKTAIKQLVANWYENRESGVIGTSTATAPMVTQLIIDNNTVPEL